MAPGKSSCGGGRSTKTWNVIQFHVIKGAGLLVDALFRAARNLECNLIQINKTDWVPLGLATSPSDSVSHSENATVKGYFSLNDFYA